MFVIELYAQEEAGLDLRSIIDDELIVQQRGVVNESWIRLATRHHEGLWAVCWTELSVLRRVWKGPATTLYAELVGRFAYRQRGIRVGELMHVSKRHLRERQQPFVF